MGPVMRNVLNMRHPVIVGAAGLVSLGCASLGMVAALAQTPPQPGEVPYLNYAPAVPAGPTRITPPAPRLELRPSSVPTAKDASRDATSATKEPVALDALKQRDQDLTALRNQQRRALE